VFVHVKKINKEAITVEVKEAIVRRLSIRRYAAANIPADHMQTLFKALQLAASGSNRQNWEFVFVGDADLKQDLISACSNQRFVGECAYFIAAVADPRLKWHMVDITISLTNFTLQATELGYGTCWIGDFDEHAVKLMLGIPAAKKVVVCMAFGKPAGRHVARGRKALEEFIYLDHYGRKWSQVT
jgi:nitroreductase